MLYQKLIAFVTSVVGLWTTVATMLGGQDNISLVLVGFSVVSLGGLVPFVIYAQTVLPCRISVLKRIPVATIGLDKCGGIGKNEELEVTKVNQLSVKAVDAVDSAWSQLALVGDTEEARFGEDVNISLPFSPQVILSASYRVASRVMDIFLQLAKCLLFSLLRIIDPTFVRSLDPLVPVIRIFLSVWGGYLHFYPDNAFAWHLWAKLTSLVDYYTMAMDIINEFYVKPRNHLAETALAPFPLCAVQRIGLALFRPTNATSVERTLMCAPNLNVRFQPPMPSEHRGFSSPA